MRRVAYLVAGFMAASPLSAAQDATVSVTVKATVIEVPCTSTRSAALRACARFEESTSLGSFKVVERLPPAHSSPGIETYRIRVDRARQVRVRTVLF